MRGTIHVIGAGLAGLAAAIRLARGAHGGVILHEAAPQAGGRCRSYFDPDRRHARLVGAAELLQGP
jgi:uncharacterized protein with NAD-binding domain and iron-sulfur cluster